MTRARQTPLHHAPGPADEDLRTARLLLRPWSDGDLAAVLDGTRQPHWAADFPADGDRVIAGYTAGHPSARGAYGQRQILERESGLVVGAIGLFWPPADGAVEFGYGIVPSRRGRGYASEAARALVAFAFTAPGVHTVRADIERSNPASGRVLEKAGLERWSSDDTYVRFRLTGPASA
ncbi:GNAT family N-acetyltransferase [Streptomyces sioyaensis]|uniref:GNAT family N-acetyltransferase n=1 Tax=Streptomyces sioyaensis TaxID=67364 RepID=UPI001F22DBE0|nr:GNAT family N-acetyltransferase [Streptomyces sioyaensis]MCF3177074.1 GNAT family N-acetyltransferase [Streptomyces sioyaensis]